ncbi:MAG: DUF4296 domain-containing protein [Cyclobacteriaceae bacterium]|nr:DUF4296 domain-containing protein [Cyclobacteriaceae bacterium]
MKKRYWAIIVILTVSCVSHDLPDNVLSEVKMAEVMLDFYMSEAKLSYNRSKVDAEEMYPHYYNKILERHNLTDSVYKANLAFYMSNPVFFDKVYDMLIDSVKLRQQIEVVEDSLSSPKKPMLKK